MERDETAADDHPDYYGSVGEHMNQIEETYQDRRPEPDSHNHINGVNRPGRIEEALGELIQAIRESDEYTQYQAIRRKVHEYPQLEQQIHEFRKKNYEIQNSKEEIDLYDRIDRLKHEEAGFRQNPLVNEYLAAELAFCRVFQNINWSILRNIDFDVGFDIE